MNKNFFISFCLLFSFSYFHGSIIISGQPDTLQNPFPFTISATAYDRAETLLFIGAHQPIVVDADKSQAISVVAKEEFAVKGITPEKLPVNNVSDQDNPLYGKQINFLESVAGNDLFVVTNDLNTRVHLLCNARLPNRSVYQSQPLLAGDGITSGIVGLAMGLGQEVSFSTGPNDIKTLARQRFFAAVRPNTGSFGVVGSAIAEGLLEIVDEGSKDKGKETIVLRYYLNQIVNAPFDTTISALKIGADLASIDNDAHSKNVVMLSSPTFYTFFTGLFVTGGPAVGDGARALTLAGTGTIAPDAAIEDNSIIGGRTTVLGENVQVSVHFLDILSTSTRLDYLVVVGGVGSPTDTAQSVYALPLDKTGVLAKKNAVPQANYNTIGAWPWLLERYFNDPAESAGDLFNPSEPDIYKARVGGNAQLPGDITAIFAEKDAVFVAIGTESATEKGGVFYSQALFDVAGAIQGWTDWQRATGSTEKIFGLAFDDKRGTFWLLPGSDVDSLTLLKKTIWQNNILSPFNQSIFASFESQTTGTQGLFDIPKTHASLSQSDGTRISILIATGYQKVVLFESGSDEGTLFTPTETVATVFEAHGGALTGLVTPVQKIEMTGGVLNDLGPIIAADIVSDGVSSWLLVGGSGGVAVLANPDGSGWPQGTLEKGFVNLPSTLVWTKLGNFKQVRKVIADGSTLYVLTSSELHRIAASADVFQNAGAQEGILLASASNVVSFLKGNGSFSDVTVSGKFALLATSGGLFRVGNGADISLAPNENLVKWQAFELPESSGPITRLNVVSPTGIQTDFAQDERPSNVYVLQANVALAQARIYRLSVQGLVGGAEITDETVQLFNDVFIKDHPTMYLNRGDYRNYIATDGAALMMTRSRYEPKIFPTFKSAPSILEIINPVVKVGERRAASGSLMYEIRPNQENPSRHIGPVIKRSATGSWMAAGTYLMVNE